MRHRRADVDQAIVVQPRPVQAADAGDVNQHAGLPDGVPQLDQQIGATGNDTGLGAVLGQKAQGFVNGSGGVVGLPHSKCS